MASIHPGVTLLRKGNGNYWVKYRDPRVKDSDGKRKQTKQSASTRDPEEATKIAIALSQILQGGPEVWASPSVRNKKVLEIWGVKPIGDTVREEITEAVADHERKTGFKFSAVGQKLLAAAFAGEIDLADQLQKVIEDRDYWRDEALKYKALVQKIEKKALVEREPLALKDAITLYFQKGYCSGKNKLYRNDVRRTFEAFAKEAALEDADIWTITDEQIWKWVYEQTTREEEPVSDGDAIKKVDALTRLMSKMTKGVFDKTELYELKKEHFSTSEKDWYWLEPEQSEALTEAVREKSGDYWADMATLQRACGFRPEELPLIQQSNCSKTDKGWQVYIEPIRDGKGKVVRRLKTKNSEDTVNVPKFAVEALERRLATKAFLLFPRDEESGEKPKWSFWTEFEREKKLWPSADDMAFSKVYRTTVKDALDEASAAYKEAQKSKDRKAKAKVAMYQPLIQIDRDKLNARTLRATCGRELLLAGRNLGEVAAVLRDRPDTVRKHYARLLGADVSTER